MNIQDVIAGFSGENFQTSGTLTKLLTNGVAVEEDDDDFQLEPRVVGQS